MLTKDQAMTASYFEHVTLKNKDGTALRARRNGQTQTWKTRPDEFRIPAKHGLKDYFNITEKTASEWRVSGS